MFFKILYLIIETLNLDLLQAIIMMALLLNIFVNYIQLML